jgi:hypothetical protein
MRNGSPANGGRTLDNAAKRINVRLTLSQEIEFLFPTKSARSWVVTEQQTRGRET